MIWGTVCLSTMVSFLWPDVHPMLSDYMILFVIYKAVCAHDTIYESDTVCVCDAGSACNAVCPWHCAFMQHYVCLWCWLHVSERLHIYPYDVCIMLCTSQHWVSYLSGLLCYRVWWIIIIFFTTFNTPRINPTQNSNSIMIKHLNFISWSKTY